ncbi:Na(+), Li(+), K(+)_H(+) antiporter [Streptomyces sp. enrichment culture]|uniref:MDR family MFS transporter n=1 Tax=Streptomyces sp. enrichment culture TaxID=1795815 RepID=UPI003F57985D
MVRSVSGLPRAFWWLWTSTLVNRLGGFVATFLAMYLTVERGHSATYAGLVAALYGLGGVASSVGAGVLADRLGRRPTLLASQLGTAFSVALLGFMEQPVAIAAAAFAVGATSNASRPAVQAMIADIVAPEDRMRAFSLNYWAINLGFAVSASAAGLIAEHGYLLLFLGEAALTLVCAVLVFVKLPESRPDAGTDGKAGAGAGAVAGRARTSGEEGKSGKGAGGVSLGNVLRDGPFMAVVGLSFLVSVLFAQTYVALPLDMAAEGLSSSDYGLAIAANGVLIVVLQIPVTRLIERRDPARLLVASSLLVGGGMGLTAFAGSTVAYALVICVWTLGEIVNAPVQTGLVARLSPVHGRGRYQGVYTLSWSLAALVAPLAAGSVIDRWGAGTLWAASAAVGAVAAAGYVLLVRAAARRDGEAAETTAEAATAAEGGSGAVADGVGSAAGR